MTLTLKESARRKQRMIDSIAEWTEDGRAKYSHKKLADYYGISNTSVRNIMADHDIMSCYEPTYTKRPNNAFSDNQPFMSIRSKWVCRRMSEWERPPGMDAHLESLREL